MGDIWKILGNFKHNYTSWSASRIFSYLDLELAEGADGFDLGNVDEVGVEAGNEAADLRSNGHSSLQRVNIIRSSKIHKEDSRRNQ